VNPSQKEIILFEIIGLIPEMPVYLDSVIPELRLKISDLGGRVIEDSEMMQVLGRLQNYKMVSFDETHIRRTIKVPIYCNDQLSKAFTNIFKKSRYRGRTI